MKQAVRGRRGVLFQKDVRLFRPARSEVGVLAVPRHRKAAEEEFYSQRPDKGLVIMDYERMSNADLYALLKVKMPAVAETVGTVRDSNRETIIAFLRFVQTRQNKPV